MTKQSCLMCLCSSSLQVEASENAALEAAEEGAEVERKLEEPLAA
jgi:hypothetical protein